MLSKIYQYYMCRTAWEVHGTGETQKGIVNECLWYGILDES
jgi:hypothetical protein